MKFLNCSENGAGCTSKYGKKCLFPYTKNGKNITGCVAAPGKFNDFKYLCNAWIKLKWLLMGH